MTSESTAEAVCATCGVDIRRAARLGDGVAWAHTSGGSFPPGTAVHIAYPEEPEPDAPSQPTEAACDEDGCDETATYYDVDSQWCGPHADEQEA